MKVKSLKRGKPTCSTIKLRSGKDEAASSMSPTSKASLFSGVIVGPLCICIFLILLERPDVFLGAQLMVVVKAIDELFPVNILLILRTPVPQMNMGIDNKDLFSGFGRKHMGSLGNLF